MAGWQKSRGAKLEARIAKELQFVRLYERPMKQPVEQL